MLWYNNPDAVLATYHEVARETRRDLPRLRLLRLAEGCKEL
jgi:hypothetical protein